MSVKNIISNRPHREMTHNSVKVGKDELQAPPTGTSFRTFSEHWGIITTSLRAQLFSEDNRNIKLKWERDGWWLVHADRNEYCFTAEIYEQNKGAVWNSSFRATQGEYQRHPLWWQKWVSGLSFSYRSKNGEQTQQSLMSTFMKTDFPERAPQHRTIQCRSPESQGRNSLS